MTEADDLRFAQRLLTLMLWDQPPPASADVVAFVQRGLPVAKQRPRFNRRTGMVYTPQATVAAEEAIAWQFVAARQHRASASQRTRFVDTVALVVLLYVPDRRRKDTDNCLKLVMDAGNKAGVWRDDSCVVRLFVSIDLDAARPRTVIALAPCLGTLSTAPLLTGSGAI